MASGIEQLDVLVDKVTSLLESHERLQRENQELQENLERLRIQVQELESAVQSRDELLLKVENTVDGMLGKLAAFGVPEISLPAENKLPMDQERETF